MCYICIEYFNVIFIHILYKFKGEPSTDLAIANILCERKHKLKYKEHKNIIKNICQLSYWTVDDIFSPWNLESLQLEDVSANSALFIRAADPVF